MHESDDRHLPLVRKCDRSRDEVPFSYAERAAGVRGVLSPRDDFPPCNESGSRERSAAAGVEEGLEAAGIQNRSQPLARDPSVCAAELGRVRDARHAGPEPQAGRRRSMGRWSYGGHVQHVPTLARGRNASARSLRTGGPIGVTSFHRPVAGCPRRRMKLAPDATEILRRTRGLPLIWSETQPDGKER